MTPDPSADAVGQDRADTASVEARAAEVLAQHTLSLSVFISDIGTCDAKGCDWRKSSMRNGEVEAKHHAHVAAALAAAGLLAGDGA